MYRAPVGPGGRGPQRAWRVTDLDNWGHAVCGRLLPEHREDGKEGKEGKEGEQGKEGKEGEAKAEEEAEGEKPAEPTEQHPGGDAPPGG